MPGRIVEVLVAVERLQLQRGAQRGGGHRQGDPAVQVVAVAGEDVVRPLVHLDVQVAGGAAAGADLALAGQPDPHAVLDAGRHLHREGAAGPDPAVAGALGHGLGMTLPVPGRSGRAGWSIDLAEERALHALHLAAAAAGRAGRRVGAGRGAGAGADVAERPRCPR